MTRDQKRKLLRFIQSLDKPEQFLQAARFTLAIGEKDLSAELIYAYNNFVGNFPPPKFRVDACFYCHRHYIHDVLCPTERT